MLKCKDIEEQASDYLDHQHAWHQRLAFRLHLLMCQNCRRYIHQLEQSIDSLRLVKNQPELSTEHQALAARLREMAKKT